MHPLLRVRPSQGISAQFLSGLCIGPPPTASESALKQSGCRRVGRKLGSGLHCSSWGAPEAPADAAPGSEAVQGTTCS